MRRGCLFISDEVLSSSFPFPVTLSLGFVSFVVYACCISPEVYGTLMGLGVQYIYHVPDQLSVIQADCMYVLTWILID